MKRSFEDKREYFPLTHAQKRIYYDDTLHPGSSVSTQAFIVRYTQILDKSLLESAINKVILKNEGFRLRIVEFDYESEPFQYILPYRKFSWDNFDFCGLNSEFRLKEWVNNTTRIPIELLDSDLFYFAYLKFNEKESGYYMKFNHIASDGWSYPMIFSEINKIYEELCAGRIVDETPYPSYTNYILEEQDYLSSEQVEKDREFWLNTLLPLPEPVPLSSRKGDPGNLKGSVLVTTFPDNLRSIMEEYCKINRTSQFKLILSSLAAYMSRISGLDDIVIASANHNRAEEERKKVVGMFVGTIPFRVQFTGDIPFIRLVEKTGKDVNYILKNHQKYPYDLIATELREISGNEIDHLLDILISAHGDVEKEVYKFEHIFQGCQSNPITIHINYNNKNIDGILELEYEYQIERFSEPDIKRFHAGLSNVLTDALMNPEKKISEIDILSPEEKNQILFEFNNTEVEYPRNKTIHELFESQVEKTPDCIAVIGSSLPITQITYRELNKKTNGLARALREKGVNPDNIVGIMVDRSLEMMFALLAALKSGGAYIPIDPVYPIERIKFYLLDSDAKLLLTQKDIIRDFEESKFKVDAIDLFDEDAYAKDKTNLEHVTSIDNTAYVIFTSGSTGKPKGVMVRHRNAVNFIKGMEDKIDFSPGKIILALTTVSFDIFFLETLLPLTLGLKIIIASEMEQKDPQLLKSTLIKNGVNILQTTPSRLKLLLSGSADFDCLKWVKEVLVGGEAFPTDLFENLKENFQGRIINVYGPTETTVWSTFNDLTEKDEINIGAPIANTQVYIFDKFMRPLSVGVVGELYIGGDGVARGYLNRPELTADRFISFIHDLHENEKNNPKPKTQNPKLYRTGDLGKWAPDGNIEFLGRIDNQVKIRGFRIEEGEIESKIVSQQEQLIKEAVVIAREDSAGEKFLCAYLVSGIKIDIAALENTLSKVLLDYMIPSYFMQIEKMPLTPNGKVDRKTLPDPKIKARGEGYEAPRDEIELKLVKIWAELLHMKGDVISIDDNFFRLGGHSLKAAVMISMIHKELDVKVAMYEIFNMSTIRKLATHLKEAKKIKYISIEPAAEKEYYPQTSTQKRLYLIEQLEKNSILYNIQLIDLYCKGVEKEPLEEAFKKLIKRHESLRTSFHMMDGEAVQKVHRYEEVGADFKIEYYETSEDGKIHADQEGKDRTDSSGKPFEEVIEHFVRPFDFTQPPLIRAGLIKIWGNTRILMMDMSHIISDGTSLVILIRDLWNLYDNEELPPLKIQYKDYAEWVSSEEQKKEIKRQEPFWLNEFSGEIPVLNLPYDYPRPTKMTFDGDSLYFEIGKKETQTLGKIARKQGVTLYIILFTIYYVLLAKLSGQEEIIVGTVTAGRDHADLRDIIGMFVETLAIRNFPQGEKTFDNFLKEVKERILAAFENQSYPFEELVSKVANRQDAGRNPLFDVVFVLGNEAERSDEYLIDVLMRDKNNPYKINRSKFDMTLMAAEKGEEIQFNLEYNTKLFNEKSVERFADYFNKIVSAVITNTGQKISDIDIIPESERTYILYRFNNTEALYPWNKTIHELFENQVSKTPDNVAVSGMGYGSGEEELSYGQLNKKSNRLAVLLRSKGIRSDDISAIMVEPCHEMIIGIIGILKAGGAFLPIDHKIPLERIKYTLEESGTKFLLSRKKLLEGIAYKGEIIKLDDPNTFIGDNNENLEKAYKFSNLAYIIYTSGSTGKPKGVMVEHRSLANLCFWHNNFFCITSIDKATKYAGFGFDASVWEVFPYLIIGASIYIVPEEIKLDIESLNRYFELNGITVAFLPTQLCEQFMTIDNKSLRVLLTGGDKLRSFVKRDYRLYNNYGPTENTVVTTSFHVTEFINNIPIGKPLFNNQIYILDKNDNLQPIGVSGELCIGGESVVRGYLNRPELTSERFISFSNDLHGNEKNIPKPKTQNLKLYRTGDLARWSPDGNIEYLGRIDHQVKIRGFRIELGEIENQLLNQKDINDAVVIAREDAPGKKYLCAYIVSEKKIDISILIDTLSKDLPDYMIPSYFIQLGKIPLNSSGKVDRKSLPDPKIKARGEGYEAPRDEIDIKLRKIWAELLHIKEDIISIDDNFFRLGGHSLKAAVMITMIHKEFDVKITMFEIFNMSTIRKLAAHMKESKKESYLSIEPAVEKEYYSQTSSQKRLYFIDQLEKNSILYNIQLLDLFCKGIEREPLEEAFRKLVKRHESLRTSFHTIEGEAVQKIHKYEEVGADFKIEYYETSEDGMIHSKEEGIEWTGLPGQPFEEVVEHFVRPFDFTQPPLIRAGLIKIWGNTRILMMDMSHIISDGTSLVILIKDLWDMYESDELPPLKLQYKDYADWTNSDKQKKEIKKQEPFWLNEFSGEIPILNLPYDYPRPPKMNFNGDMIHFEIDIDETRKLNAIAQAHSHTLYMVLFSIYYVLLSKLSGQEEIIVGTVTAGRGHADLHDIVGMFVDTLAIRNYPEGEKPFNIFMKEVKERTLAAFENQDYPFEQLVSKVAQRQDTGRNPLFDMVFGLDNETDRTEEYLHDVLMLDKTNPFRIKRSKFDMTLMGAETGEELQFNIEYNTSLFTEKTIERFVKYFKKVISSICEDIGQKISHIEIIPDAENAFMLHLFNDTESLYPWEKTIHELFEEQTAKTPDNVAVVFYSPGNKSQVFMNYRELNRKSDQMAHVLRANGVVSESIVGIMAEKSIGMIIGILGILKAGGAYLPMNIDYPEERKRYILDDCRSHIMLSNFKELDYVSMVIDLDDPNIYNVEEEFLNDYRSGSLAYVMYTSGSTGKPKGVMVEHMNVVRLVKNTNFLNFEEKHRILQTGALEFDASTFEIWGALLNGSSFYLASKDTILNIEKLKDTIRSNRITTLWMTSALFNQMLEMDIEIFDGLKYLLTGGDIVSSVHVNKLISRFPGITVINGYGPTENTTFSTSHTIAKEIKERSIPIGRPINNSTAYILDGRLQPVPIGVPGELYVGGDGVSRGYLNNPELTHEKFFQNVFEPHIKKINRIYATGDVARWLQDGTIEFLGRKDHQVKIRGFRIELGEIENLLLSQKNMNEVVVIAREDEPGKKYLCAYFSAETKVDWSLLKKSMSSVLPNYMMPSYFVQLEKIPLNTNGKVDRKMLPIPEMKEISGTYTAPRDAVEEILAKVWSEALGIEKVGIDDNFFDIGGDSIKTILITGKLRKLGLGVNVNDFFSSRSIRRLAVRVGKVERVISQEIVFGEVELTPIQRWYFDKPFNEKHHFNHVVTRHSMEGFDEKIVETVFTKIVEHHDALRTVYEINKDNVVQRIRKLGEGKLFDLEIIGFGKEMNIEENLEKEIHRINSGVDLKTGPLAKLGLCRTVKGDYLLIGIHHAVVDGISWRVLIEDFETAVELAKIGEEIKLQDKTDSFKEWAFKLKEYADSPNALKELEYWKTIEETEIKKLPVDHEVGKEKKIYKNSDLIAMNLGKEETEKLIKDVNFVYNTEINDILLTALGMAIYRWSGNEKIVVNLEGHGREVIIEDINISRTVGWFTTQYPVLLDMKPEDEVLTEEEESTYCIRQVKETLRRVPNKGVGYGILKYLTSPGKKENMVFKRTPEISFNYLGQLGGAASLTGSMSPGFDMDFAVDINGSVGENGLILYFGFNKYEYDSATIEKLTGLYKENLLKIIDRCVKKKEEIVALGMNSIEYHIKNDREKYLERVKTERFPDLSVKNYYKHIMVTGAAGFMGAYIVPALLENMETLLYLPVRAVNQDEAEKRFKKKMLFYFGKEFFEIHKNRIEVLRSDLGEERLGIDADRYKRLSECVEAIVDPAANVKHHGVYEELYKDNVMGTEHLLEFAVTGKQKDFYYVSTIDTCAGNIPGREYAVFSEYCHDIGQKTDQIYIKSKFEAEKRVLAYRSNGLNASIYRVGNLIFHSETGKFQENIGTDYFYAIIRGALKLGILSDNMKKMIFDMSFIDYIAKATVLLMTRKNLRNETCHIANPNRLPMVEMAEFFREMGIELNDVKQEDVETYFSKFEGDSEYEKIIEMLKLHSWVFEEKEGTRTVAVIDRTVALLEKLGFRWPKVTKQHIEKMVAYCKEVGFI